MTSTSSDCKIFKRKDGVYLVLDPSVQASKKSDIVKLWSSKTKVLLEYKTSIFQSVDPVEDASQFDPVALLYQEWVDQGGLKSQQKEFILQMTHTSPSAPETQPDASADKPFDPLREEDPAEAASAKKKTQQNHDFVDSGWFYADEDDEEEDQ